jgi:hypothetical protein
MTKQGVKLVLRRLAQEKHIMRESTIHPDGVKVGAETARAATTGECSSVLHETGRHIFALLGVQVKPKLYSHLMAYGTIIDISISKARMLKSC